MNGGPCQKPDGCQPRSVRFLSYALGHTACFLIFSSRIMETTIAPKGRCGTAQQNQVCPPFYQKGGHTRLRKNREEECLTGPPSGRGIYCRFKNFTYRASIAAAWARVALPLGTRLPSSYPLRMPFSMAQRTASRA